MLRVVGSLVTGQVRAYDLPRMFGCQDVPPRWAPRSPSTGRIAKPLHLLRVVDPVNDTYRRQVNRQLTSAMGTGAAWLCADVVCHGTLIVRHRSLMGKSPGHERTGAAQPLGSAPCEGPRFGFESGLTDPRPGVIILR
ncbi:transposase [Streptomyces canus]|uniref:transposase n=1 Tax=Streptomyces canus TaxID=58343 RepID=UPI00216AB896|nr:transposase [Streptomyces canus]